MEKKKKSPAKLVTSVIIYTIFALVVIMLLYVFISLMMGVQPSIFGYKLYYVLTESMTGTIDKGDVIITKNIKDVGSIKEGDIVTFIAPSGFKPKEIEGQFITHRIIKAPFEKDGKTYVHTKGDYNASADDVFVPVENVVGKYVKTSVFLAGLMEFLRHWYGFVTLIIAPLVIVLIIEIVRIIKMKAKDNEEKFNKQKQEDIDKAVKEALEQAKAYTEKEDPKEEDEGK